MSKDLHLAICSSWYSINK